MEDNNKKRQRSGPHPLSLHVASATQNWTGAAASFPLFQLGAMQLHPTLSQQAETLREKIKALDPMQLQLSVMKAAQRRLSATLAGISAYQQHPYVRTVPQAPLFHRLGTAELRDYGKDLDDNAPVVIAVPSLVNPAYILDLMEDHSFMRYLTQQGIHSYLLDWTVPGKAELEFGLEDYITQRLIPLIKAVHHFHKRKIHLLGYCMGGNLSLAAAQILQKENCLESLTLIATPWDFHADQPAHLPALTDIFLKAESFMENPQAVPMNLLQMFFFSLDPGLSDRKFRRFSGLVPSDPETRLFVAIEDWANDGAPLSPKVAKDCLLHWYQENQTKNKQWRIADEVIDPSRLSLPGHIVIPQADRIVSPASAKSLQDSLPRFTRSAPQGGHVKMIAGQRAKETLWLEIALYLK